MERNSINRIAWSLGGQLSDKIRKRLYLVLISELDGAVSDSAYAQLDGQICESIADHLYDELS